MPNYKAGEIVCPGNVKGFQSISLSRNTVAERVTDLATNLSDQIKAKSSSFESFSIACDESTDISGKAQLAVFLRSCDKNFNIFEELLELIPMPGTTTGQDIFTCVFKLLQKYNPSTFGKIKFCSYRWRSINDREKQGLRSITKKKT